MQNGALVPEVKITGRAASAYVVEWMVTVMHALATRTYSSFLLCIVCRNVVFREFYTNALGGKSGNVSMRSAESTITCGHLVSC